HIWAEKYDSPLKDIFAVQDDITERVVAAVEPHLYAEEGFRASRHPDNINAWRLAVRALGLINKMDRESNRRAQELLRQAIAVEPESARAHALLGQALQWAAHCEWDSAPPEARRQATSHAQKAASLDPSDPWGRMVFGLTLSSAGQHQRALVEL